MGIILNARKALKMKVLLQLYHSFVTLYLIYCLEILGNASDTHLHSLITLSIILLYGSHTTNILCNHLNVLPFKKLNMFFIKNRSVHNYSTRNKDELRPDFAKHALRDRDFRLVGVHVWNYICDNIKNATSFSSFKNILKMYFI